MASMASPPPLLSGVMGGAISASQNNSSERSDSYSSSSSSSSSIENVKPSIITIILILSITVLVSLSICLLLRHLNRRCLRHLSRSSTSTITSVASHRVSPEQSPTASLLDSLPVFTFSSITRRSNNDSTISGDCAICLSKFEPHDQLRLLPLCCHAFHAYCIDTWLTSNQSCPLCRSPLFASKSDLMKVLLQSSNAAGAIGSGGSDSFRLEIGSISHRQPGSDSGDQRRSYSVGSFDYIVEEESEVTRNQTHRRNVSDKEEVGGADQAASEASLAAEVASGRSWLKEYVDRLSSSLSSRSLSFRSSGRFFTGSSRRNDTFEADFDVEANRIGEEISEMFRWFSGV